MLGSPCERRASSLPPVGIEGCRSSRSSRAACLFMFTAPRCSCTRTSTRPSRRPAAADLLAIGLTFVIAAGADRLCSRHHRLLGFVFALLFRNISSPARGRRSAGLRPAGRLITAPGRQVGIPSFIARSARSSSGSAWRRAVGRQVLRARGAEQTSVWQWWWPLRRSVPYDWQNQISIQAVWTGLVGCPVVHPQPPPLRRAHLVHRRFPRRVARGPRIDVDRRNQAFHPDGRARRGRGMFLTLENKNYFRQSGQGYLLTPSLVLIGNLIFGARRPFGTLSLLHHRMIEAGLWPPLTGEWVHGAGPLFLGAVVFYSYMRSRSGAAPRGALGFGKSATADTAAALRPARRTAIRGSRPQDSKYDSNMTAREVRMRLSTITLAGAALALAGIAPALARTRRQGRHHNCRWRQSGDGATLAADRSGRGAKALGVDKLNAQFSAWAP